MSEQVSAGVRLGVSLELALGTLLTGGLFALVVLSGWVFPDEGMGMDLAARL